MTTIEVRQGTAAGTVMVTGTLHRVWRSLNGEDSATISARLDIDVVNLRVYLNELRREGLAVVDGSQYGPGSWKWRRAPGMTAVTKSIARPRKCIGKGELGEPCTEIVGSTGPGHRLCNRCRRRNVSPFAP